MKILITGASSGFGKLSTLDLLNHGHKVMAGVRGGLDRWRELHAQDPLKTEIDEALRSGSLTVVDLHMDQASSIEKTPRWIDELFGGELDVLINNAGIGFYGPTEEQEIGLVRQQMEVNFFGPVLLTQKLLPYLRKSRGRIINMSSALGLVSLPFTAFYSATKFALEAYTEALFSEVRPFGIQVCLIQPGGFKTEFSQKSFHPPGHAPGHSSYESTLSVYDKRRTRFQTMYREQADRYSGNPDKVVKLISKLCSKSHLPIRVPVGRDSHMAALARRLIPHTWRARMVDFLYRKLIFGE